MLQKQFAGLFVTIYTLNVVKSQNYWNGLGYAVGLNGEWDYGTPGRLELSTSAQTYFEDLGIDTSGRGTITEFVGTDMPWGITLFVLFDESNNDESDYSRAINATDGLDIVSMSEFITMEQRDVYNFSDIQFFLITQDFGT